MKYDFKYILGLIKMEQIILICGLSLKILLFKNRHI